MSVAAQETKMVAVTNPVAIVNNASWTTTEVDTVPVLGPSVCA